MTPTAEALRAQLKIRPEATRESLWIEVTGLEALADCEEDLDNAAKAKRLRAKAKKLRALIDAMEQRKAAQ